MAEKQIKLKTVKQELSNQLDKIDELATAVYDSKIRLNEIKPLNHFENETKEIIIEILKNQARISQIMRSTLKYMYKKIKEK